MRTVSIPSRGERGDGMKGNCFLFTLMVLLFVLVVTSWDVSMSHGKELTIEKLKNTELQSLKYGMVKLRDGQASNLAEDTVMLSEKPNSVAFGDLNGDGVEDATVILWSFYNISACDVELIAIVNEAGIPKQKAARLLGDQVGVNALAIVSGAIVVDVTKHRPDDPHCCPSLRSIEIYRLEGESLVALHESIYK